MPHCNRNSHWNNLLPSSVSPVILNHALAAGTHECSLCYWIMTRQRAGGHRVKRSNKMAYVLQHISCMYNMAHDKKQAAGAQRVQEPCCIHSQHIMDITCCTTLICTRYTTFKAYVGHVSVCSGDYRGYKELLPYIGDPCTRGYNVTLIQLLPLYHMMLPPLSADSLLPTPAAPLCHRGRNQCVLRSGPPLLLSLIYNGLFLPC